jgi:hypothetical protein
MSVLGVKQEFRKALRNKILTKDEAIKIVKEAEKKISLGERNAVVAGWNDAMDNYRVTLDARKIFMQFFKKNF